MTDAEIRQIEAQVNAEILANAAAQARVMDIESAQKTGAMMLFGEKYGETVRVLDIGSSRELCGGTHVKATGDIGLFKIVAEGGVAAGVRRIEAVTGQNAFGVFAVAGRHRDPSGRCTEGPTGRAEQPHCPSARPSQSPRKRTGRRQRQAGFCPRRRAVDQAVDVKGIKLLVAKLDGADAKTLRDTMDKLKDKLKTAAVILLTAVDGDKGANRGRRHSRLHWQSQGR